MKANIKEINIRVPRYGLVEHIENMLKDAKSGELVGMLDVQLWHGGAVSSGWHIGTSEYLRTLIGETELLKH